MLSRRSDRLEGATSLRLSQYWTRVPAQWTIVVSRLRFLVFGPFASEGLLNFVPHIVTSLANSSPELGFCWFRSQRQCRPPYG